MAQALSKTPPQPVVERLDSWKEIAEYLKRDLRTVRRWEKEKGLPVHRVPGGERQAVFAYVAEIDAWLHRIKTPNSLALESQEPFGRTFAQGARHGWWWKPILPLRRATLALIGVIFLAALAVVLVRARSSADSLDNVVFSGNSVQARGPKGDVLWTYSFDRTLWEADEFPERIQITDLSQSGQKQVAVVAPFDIPAMPNSSSDALFALSTTGKLRWRFDFNQTFQFAGTTSGAPWIFGGLMTTQDRNHSYLWSAMDSTFGSPSVMVKFDEDGNRLAEFVNWGHIHALAHFTSGDGSFILAGGINNECNCAMLAVLLEEQPSGSSPPLTPSGGGSELTCDNCPPGRPYRYLLFPRSEVADATDFTYNQVGVIVPGPDGIRVGVKETNTGMPLGADWEMYQLSPDFTPQSFTISDHLSILHQQLEAQGKIKHTLAQCPELHLPKAIKIWSQHQGWRTVMAQPM